MANKRLKNGLIVLRVKKSGKDIPAGFLRVRAYVPGSDSKPCWLLISEADYEGFTLVPANTNKEIRKCI
jgi:hypothetical protein